MLDKRRLIKNYNIALHTIYDVIGKHEVKKQMRKVIKLDISPRAIKRHGVCKYVKDGCVIEVSKHLFEVNDKEMITTLIHEILHTFKNTKGHNYKWKWYADKISDNTEYKITRTRNIEGFDVSTAYKYIITCEKCGLSTKQQRISKKRIFALNNKECKCLKCGSHDFKIENIG